LIDTQNALFKPVHNRLQFHHKLFQSSVTIRPETNERCQAILLLRKMIALTFCRFETQQLDGKEVTWMAHSWKRHIV